MKKFHFTLERVRQFREKQLALEEAQLRRLVAEKTLVEQRRALLEKQARESASVVEKNASIEASELQALDAFRLYAARQHQLIASALADCDCRIVEQRGKLTEAKRKFELLGRLKDRKLLNWNRELARELEAQAGETFLAKWTGSRL